MALLFGIIFLILNVWAVIHGLQTPDWPAILLAANIVSGIMCLFLVIHSLN